MEGTMQPAYRRALFLARRMKILPLRRELKLFFFFITFSLIVFLCYPLHHSLPGEEDSVLNLAIYKTMYMRLMDLFRGHKAGIWCYPALNFQKLVSMDLGGAVTFLCIQTLLGDVIWSWWLYVSLIYALNAMGFSMVLNELGIKSLIPSMAGGIFFAFSSYSLGNIDNVNFINLSLSLSGLAFILRGINRGSAKHLALGLVLHTAELFISPYGFFFFSFLIMFFIAGKLREGIKLLLNGRGIVVICFALSMIATYACVFMGIDHRDYTNILDGDFLGSLVAFNFIDFLKRPANLLFFRSVPDEVNTNFIYNIRQCYPGISLTILALIGSFRNPKYVLLFLLGILLASGLHLTYGYHLSYRSPLAWFYLLLREYIRLPIRWYIISQFALSILGTFGLNTLYQRLKVKSWILLLPLMFISEQVSMPFYTYHSQTFLDYDAQAMEYIRKSSEISNMAFLPSSLFDYNHKGNRREHIYMYWQTVHAKNIVNGDLAFLPPQRTQNNKWMSEPSFNNLDSLISKNKLDAIVLCKDFWPDPGLSEWKAILEKYPGAVRKMENPRTIIYAIK